MQGSDWNGVGICPLVKSNVGAVIRGEAIGGEDGAGNASLLAHSPIPKVHGVQYVGAAKRARSDQNCISGARAMTTLDVAYSSIPYYSSHSIRWLGKLTF